MAAAEVLPAKWLAASQSAPQNVTTVDEGGKIKCWTFSQLRHDLLILIEQAK